MKNGPTYQRYNIPPNAPLSSQMVNDAFDGWLVGFAVIFNTSLPDMTSLKSKVDQVAEALTIFEEHDLMVRGATGETEQGDHTSNWRHV